MSRKVLLQGVRWTLLTTILRRVVSLGLFVFLAKWLTQDDFGIYRSFSLILVLLTYFTNLGLDYHYLVSRKQAKLNFHALLQLALIASLVITLLLVGSGVWLGELYHSRYLGKLISVLGGLIFVEALRRVARVKAQKLLLFKELALAETLNVFLYSALSLVLIFFWRKVWLFIVLFYVGNLAELLYLAAILPPLHRADLTRLCQTAWLKKTLSVMGKQRAFLANVSLINIFQMYSSNAPVLFLGALVAPNYLGIYFFASQLIAIPVGMFTTSLSQVFFPLLAQNNASSNLQGIRRYTSLVLKIGIPALFAYALALQYLVPLIWGNKWLEALPLILALVLYYGTSLLHNPISSIPYICRKPSWELIWNLITLILRIAALAIGSRVSFSFAVLLFCIVSAVMHLAFYYLSLALLKADLKEISLYLLSHLPVLTILGIAGLYALSYSLIYPLVIFSVYCLYLVLAEKATLQDLMSLLKPAN